MLFFIPLVKALWRPHVPFTLYLRETILALLTVPACRYFKEKTFPPTFLLLTQSKYSVSQKHDRWRQKREEGQRDGGCSKKSNTGRVKEASRENWKDLWSFRGVATSLLWWILRQVRQTHASGSLFKRSRQKKKGRWWPIPYVGMASIVMHVAKFAYVYVVSLVIKDVHSHTHTHTHTHTHV